MNRSKEKYVWLGSVPVGIGAVIKGWDILEKDFKSHDSPHVVDFRVMTNKCPHDCFFCFTDKNKKTLSLNEIKRVISEINESGTRGVNFVGEGEPTIDKDFFEIIEFTSSLDMVPVVFTDGVSKLRNRDFIKRLKNSEASVIPKCDSLFNREYQNRIVGDKTNTYFDKRNEAVRILIEEGFNEISIDGTTRLGFDMVISNENINEIPETLRFYRKNNIWIIFSLYLPSGRVLKDNFDNGTYPSMDQILIAKNKIFEIDKNEFNFTHHVYNNFLTFGCVERLQIFGDGRVSPCPGNEKVIGRIQDYSIKELNQMILFQFPAHNPSCFDGNCIYREI